MALTAGTVLTSCRTALLNDPTGAIYPDSAMYPVMSKAYRELQTKMVALGVAFPKEISAAITVTAGTVRLADGASLPTDIVSPIQLWERVSGATTSQWEDMTERDVEPVIIPADTVLRYWAWREDEIKFPAASTDREVLIQYYKQTNAISASGSVITILNCQQWLEQRTAVIAAATIGANPTRAKMLSEDLKTLWDDFKATQVKKAQNLPVRRRRTRYRRP